MLHSKKQILYIREGFIQPAAASGPLRSPGIEREHEVPWTRETLTETLLDLKKKFGGTFSVILDDDLTFTFGISIPADTKEEKSFVRIKAAEEVPEEIGDSGWDFKEVLGSPDKKTKIVQFASVDGKFYKDFSKAVQESEIKIASMEPVSCSLARLLAERPEPVLVIHKGPKNLVFLSYHRLVFFVESFDAEPTSKELLKFLEFVKEKFNVAPKVVFLSGKFDVLKNDDPAFAGCKVETGELDPFSGMAMKGSAGDNDEVSVNILLMSAQPSGEDALSKKIVGISEIDKEPGAGDYVPLGLDDEAVRKYPQGRSFTYVIFGCSLLIMAINGIILFQRSQVQALISNAPIVIVTHPAPVSVPSSQTTATSSQVLDLKAYNIEILNGSGKSGAAKAMQTLLEAKGFKVAMTGNASSSNYQNTVLSYKDSVPSDYRNAVEQALKTVYNIKETSPLPSGGKVDLKVIIGKK